MAKATKTLMEQLHEAVAKDLLDRINRGEATDPELQAAIKFLKDNHIESDVESNPDLQKLHDQVMPSFHDDEVDEARPH